MKKNMLIAILVGTLMTAVVLTGCQSSAANTESEENAETSDAVVKPLYPMENAQDAMADGGYPVSFTADDLVKTDTGYELTVEVYNYDQYEIEDIDTLEKGSKIRFCNQEITVDEVEKDDDTGYVTINGGIENGGIELTVEDGVYRTETMDNYPSYYSLGKITIPLSEDVTFEDWANSETGEDSTVAQLSDLPAEIADSEIEFTCYNTVITVRQEQIVQIIRYWVP